jgi:predicted phage terminase large subunit-like protein
MVLLQTPLNPFDLIETCMKDPQWHGLAYGCFDEAGESRWPTRFSTETLKADKLAHVHRNQLALWMREMECTIVAEESASFRQEWLGFYDVLPDRMTTIIAIDPASSDRPDADFLAIVVVGFHQGKVYLLDYYAQRSVMPDAVVSEFFNFVLKYRPLKLVVESIGYQRTLAWYMRREMEKRRIFVAVHEVQDRRKKSDRIIQALLSIASNGRLFVRRDQVEFIQQFVEYSPLFRGHDDIIDAVAMAITAQNSGTYEGDFSYTLDDERDIPNLPNWRAAP